MISILTRFVSPVSFTPCSVNRQRPGNVRGTCQEWSQDHRYRSHKSFFETKTLRILPGGFISIYVFSALCRWNMLYLKFFCLILRECKVVRSRGNSEILCRSDISWVTCNFDLDWKLSHTLCAVNKRSLCTTESYSMIRKLHQCTFKQRKRTGWFVRALV